jgi:hypothetical protein
MSARLAAINVEVQPLPHLPSTRFGESSTSGSQDADTAYATVALLETLAVGSSDTSSLGQGLYVAVQWPEERRIPGKGKRRSLIIQVKPPPDYLVS